MGLDLGSQQVRWAALPVTTLRPGPPFPSRLSISLRLEMAILGFSVWTGAKDSVASRKPLL